MELRARVFLYAFVATFGLVGCQEPTTFEATNTDKFTYDNEDDYTQAKRVLKADYVIAVDYGFRMNGHVEELIATFESFLDDLSGIDYRVGFVRGSTQNSSSSSEGKEATRNGTPTNFMGKTFLTPGSPFSKVDSMMSSLGEPNEPNKVIMLEAVTRTLDKQKSKFLRDSAQLVVAFFSNSDDVSHEFFGSSRTTSYYKNKLKSYKSNDDYVSARAFVRQTAYNGLPINEGACESVGPTNQNYKAGARLMDVADGIDAGNNGVHCLGEAEDMADMLYDLARDVTRPTKRFKVQSKAVGTTVKVFIDGDEVAKNDPQNSWSFNASTNEVIFATGDEPDPNANLLITFVPVLELSRDPDQESMSVTVNGNKISRSNSNGWSLSGRRLLFHGSAVPDHGDKIVVNYEVN